MVAVCLEHTCHISHFCVCSLRPKCCTDLHCSNPQKPQQLEFFPFDVMLQGGKERGNNLFNSVLINPNCCVVDAPQPTPPREHTNTHRKVFEEKLPRERDLFADFKQYFHKHYLSFILIRLLFNIYSALSLRLKDVAVMLRKHNQQRSRKVWNVFLKSCLLVGGQYDPPPPSKIMLLIPSP